MNDLWNEFIAHTFHSDTTQTRFHASKKGRKCFTVAQMRFGKKNIYQAFQKKIRSKAYAEALRPLSIPVTHDQILNDRENPVFQVEFVDKECLIIFRMNHYYIGGGQFWEIFANANPGDKAKGPELPESNFALGMAMLPLMVYDFLHVDPVPLRLTQRANKVYHATYRMTIPTNKRFVGIHSVGQELFRSLGLETSLKIAMTTAMREIPDVRNNVGALFLDIDPTDSPAAIQEKCAENLYMAHSSNVSNLLDLGISSNVDMRKYVHCVFTSLYSYTPTDWLDVHLFPSSPVEENVYVFMNSFIEGDQVKMNVTYMTRLLDFKPTKHMKRVL